MTKKQIEECIDEDWVEAFDGLSPDEVAMWIEKNVPEGYYLDLYYGYEYQHGQLKRTREETDEEYAERLALEKKAQEDREAERVRQAYLLQNKIAVLKGMDTALASYLEKHKNNPHIGDMENLFTAIARSTVLGENKGPVVQEMEDILKELEKHSW